MADFYDAAQRGLRIVVVIMYYFGPSDGWLR